MTWQWLLALAPFLLLLACPLIMWSMMKGMSGGACQEESGAQRGAGEAALQQEVEVLRARVADLEGASRAARSGAGDGIQVAERMR